jgi:hypothetical protein
LSGLQVVSGSGVFLQTDPEPGGSANNYDYCNQDPINCYDLGGTTPKLISTTNSIVYDSGWQHASKFLDGFMYAIYAIGLKVPPFAWASFLMGEPAPGDSRFIVLKTTAIYWDSNTRKTYEFTRITFDLRSNTSYLFGIYTSTSDHFIHSDSLSVDGASPDAIPNWFGDHYVGKPCPIC